MTEKRQCPKCGAELSPDAAQGLCPKCLLDAGLESQTASAHGEAATGPFVTPSQAAAATVPKPERFAAPGLETLAAQFPQLDNFEHLGRGGMGVVYKARQRQLNRPVAVKILPPSAGDDPAFAERFTREAQALARLNHSNIVQVYDFGRTEDHFYFIMEYVDGVNLRALIHDGQLKPEEALKIVPQICEALQFAHDEGIVHRDIKPENILIDKKGRVKIADFGLAKLLGHAADDLSLTGTGQLMGTLGYMAPAQLQQAHAVDHRADIYSLGVVFYEMLTGQLPIGRFQPPSKKVQVDVRLDEIVLRSLESEPDRRYQHASDVRTDLEQIGVDSKLQVRSPEQHLHLIPYKNGPAVMAYYAGVFSLIPCIGFISGIAAIVLGVMGAKNARKHLEVQGSYHAWAGIILGSLVVLAHLSALVYLNRVLPHSLASAALGWLALLLSVVGLLLYAAGWVGLWIEAFRQSILRGLLVLLMPALTYAAGWVSPRIGAFGHSILWGLLVFLLPPVTVVFALGLWRTARKPALALLIGAGLAVLGYFLMPGP